MPFDGIPWTTDEPFARERTFPHSPVLLRTDPNDNATSYAHDPLLRLVMQTDALGSDTGLSYDSAGNLSAVVDARDNTTTYSYNGFGDVTAEDSPDRGAISYSSVDKAIADNIA